MSMGYLSEHIENAQLALDLAAEATGAKRQPCHLYAGPSERYPVRRRGGSRVQRNTSNSSEHARGESGLQKIASGEISHVSLQWTASYHDSSIGTVAASLL